MCYSDWRAPDFRGFCSYDVGPSHCVRCVEGACGGGMNMMNGGCGGMNMMNAGCGGNGGGGCGGGGCGGGGGPDRTQRTNYRQAPY